MKLLLIDDDPSIVMLLELILSTAGHEVFATQDVESAYKQLESTTGWEGIILDFLLPNIDGSKLKSDICTRFNISSEQVVFLTASPEVVEKRHKCLSKPFSPLHIEQQICDILTTAK